MLQRIFTVISISPCTGQNFNGIVTGDVVEVGVLQVQPILALVMQANLSKEQAQVTGAGDVVWNIKLQHMVSPGLYVL